MLTFISLKKLINNRKYQEQLLKEAKVNLKYMKHLRKINKS